mgnify:CR=1 FL=1
MRDVGRIGLRALVYFELVSTLALVIGLIVVTVLQPGAGFNVDPATLDPAAARGYAEQLVKDNPNDTKHETFENLFPTNHKFYGYMDFVSLQNLHNIRGIFEIKPHPRLSLAAEGHAFWLADTSDNFYNVAGAPRRPPGARSAPKASAGSSSAPFPSRSASTRPR